MSKVKTAKFEGFEAHHIDHEVRIRILEHLSAQINNKMNIALTLIVGSLVFPMVLKWLGWA